MTTISASQAQAMLHTMADMQDEHNVLVHPQWREGFEFYRGVGRRWNARSLWLKW